VLDTLAEGGELGTNELARRTGMTPSTMSRQLGTLAASGLVERVGATGRYRLGIRLIHLANAVLARLDVREVARPHLVALVEATGETATLSVPGDEDAITVDFVSGSHQIQPVSRLGRPSIAHATSAGKVMLAFGGCELPDGPFRAYTTRTITDREALASEIERCASVGTHRRRASASRGWPRSPLRSVLPAASWRRSWRCRDRATDSTRAVETALPLLLEHAATISRELGWDVS
jgi:IclR family acetate operon transcriptional repressor